MVMCGEQMSARYFCIGFACHHNYRSLSYHTPYSKMAPNKLLFCLHANWPSLPHFHFIILLVLTHVDEAKRAN